MRITYSPRAVADIAFIADYIAERNPRAARAVESRIGEGLDRLAEFPGMGPAVRVIPLGRYPYLLFYTIAGHELVVLHVRHASRKPLTDS
jgi:plasmid stabilization system protein ParE